MYILYGYVVVDYKLIAADAVTSAVFDISAINVGV